MSIELWVKDGAVEWTRVKPFVQKDPKALNPLQYMHFYCDN